MFKIELMTLALLMVSIALKKHSLTILLRLELMILMVIILTLIFGQDLFYVLIIICIGACEGAVGLRTLIRIARLKRDVEIRCV